MDKKVIQIIFLVPESKRKVITVKKKKKAIITCTSPGETVLNDLCNTLKI